MSSPDVPGSRARARETCSCSSTSRFHEHEHEPGARGGRSRARRIWLQLAVAGAILAYLVATDRLTLAPLGAVAAHPATLVALIALQLGMLAIGVVRWWFVLRAIDGRAPPYRRMLAGTWVGQFFGCVAPSAVATDVARYRYLDGGAAVLTSILVDRLIGVTSIVVLAALTARAALLDVIDPLRLLAVLAIVVLAATLVVRRRADVRAALVALARAPGTAALALGLGVAGHACKVASLWLIVAAVVPEAPASAVLAIAPLGFLIEAIPLAPGGLGTAHLAFEHLLGLHGVAGGAALFNVYFVTRLAVSLVGGAIWVLSGARGFLIVPRP